MAGCSAKVTKSGSTSSRQVATRQITIAALQWRYFQQTIWLSSQALEDWFGIQSDIRTGRLMVNFTTAQQHPVHARLKRQKRYQQLAQRLTGHRLMSSGNCSPGQMLILVGDNLMI